MGKLVSPDGLTAPGKMVSLLTPNDAEAHICGPFFMPYGNWFFNIAKNRKEGALQGRGREALFTKTDEFSRFSSSDLLHFSVLIDFLSAIMIFCLKSRTSHWLLA